MTIFYTSPFDHKFKVLELPSTITSIDEFKNLIASRESIPNARVDFNLYHGGKILNDCLFLNNNKDVWIDVAIPLKGGKGGFGSMLRAIGAQIEKTTNREACRDLSGRRLRDVNEEARIKEWVKKQDQRKEEEKKKQKEKLKRLAELTVPSTCQYNDTEFEKDRAEIPDIVEDSINYGLKQSEGDSKRKIEQIENPESNSSSDKSDSINKAKKFKKQNLWLGVDIDSDESSDDSDQDEHGQTDKSSTTDSVKSS